MPVCAHWPSTVYAMQQDASQPVHLHTLGQDGPVLVCGCPGRLRMCAPHSACKRRDRPHANLHTPDQHASIPACVRPGRLGKCAPLRVYAMQQDAWQLAYLHTLGQDSSVPVCVRPGRLGKCTTLRVYAAHLCNATGCMATCTL